MKIVLLEDEIIVARDIKSRLGSMGYPDVETHDNGLEFLAYIDEFGADLCIIDININGDINGIETVTRMQEKIHIPIIYLTAQGDKETFDQAKSTKPSAYLLKPYNQFELQTTIELAIEQFEDQIEQKEEDKTLNVVADKVFIKHNGRYDRIKVNDILYLEAFGNYTEINTLEKKYTITAQLGKLESSLLDSHLFRCHRSFIVNLDKVDGFDDSCVFIEKKIIPISKGQRSEFMSRLRIL
ncbi:MAG: DNA-binding LytR/AlgR family response regulator [Crocinitomicaceae bacterium]|jgi:DNA-binding LytR/AlgR family response regulator